MSYGISLSGNLSDHFSLSLQIHDSSEIELYFSLILGLPKLDDRGFLKSSNLSWRGRVGLRRWVRGVENSLREQSLFLCQNIVPFILKDHLPSVRTFLLHLDIHSCCFLPSIGQRIAHISLVFFFDCFNTWVEFVLVLVSNENWVVSPLRQLSHSPFKSL